MFEIELVKNTDPRIPYSLLTEADPNESAIRDYLARSSVLLCWIRGVLSGIVVYEVTSTESCLWNLSVSDAFRRRGAATALIKAACNRAKLAGAASITVGTGNSSLGQLALYQKCGFRIESIRTDYFASYDPPIFERGIRCLDMIVLRRNL